MRRRERPSLRSSWVAPGGCIAPSLAAHARLAAESAGAKLSAHRGGGVGTPRWAKIHMMTRQLCIAALLHIRVSDSLGRGERLGEDIFLTNDAETIKKLITPTMLRAFGGLEMVALAEAGIAAYRLAELPGPPSREGAERAVLEFLLDLRKFQVALWLVCDNAASIERAFLEWPHRGRNPIASTNDWDALCTTASGTRDIATFTREEFRTARKLHGTLWAKEDVGQFRAGEPTEPTSKRFSRALYFLQGARRSAALSIKVAEFCSAFEALLSTDSSELSHKLAERLAWIVAPSPDARFALFRRLKTAYSIRSTAVHGATLTQKKIEAELQAAARDCDDLLRQLFLKIGERPDLRRLYIESEAKVEDLEAALVRITLGVTGS